MLRAVVLKSGVFLDKTSLGNKFQVHYMQGNVCIRMFITHGQRSIGAHGPYHAHQLAVHLIMVLNWTSLSCLKDIGLRGTVLVHHTSMEGQTRFVGVNQDACEDIRLHHKW